MSMTELFEAVRCPFCGAASAQLLSLFGSQLLLSQYRCAACGSYFEGVRPDRWDSEPDAAAVPTERAAAPSEPATVQPDIRSRTERASPSRNDPPRSDLASDTGCARVCEHAEKSVLPATGENHDGR